ncbi:MAG TPA: cyclic nucleotide-binding domain-containing protein [Vicinamibacterales bacterium]
MLIGGILLVVTLVLRGIATNRFIRTRLSVSTVMFGAYVVARSLVDSALLPANVATQIRLGYPLLLAFGGANALVALLINPWRQDHLPDRFPNIVQDAIVIGLFGTAAAIFMPDRIAATTAVGAVVIGFALQDTLGNLFSGLAIQVEKPFHVGQWVTIGGKDGKVTEITWRATKIRTKAGNFVIVPNSVLSHDTITNYSEPTDETMLEVEVGVSYDTAPNDVRTVIRAALMGESALVAGRPLDVFLVEFGHSAILYRVRFWITDFGADEPIRDKVRTLIYYAFRRHGITIPYPIQVYVEHDGAIGGGHSQRAIASSLAGVEILDSLSDAQRAELVESARPLLYAKSETIVREGDRGNSMFVLLRGEAVVTLADTTGNLARLGAGAFFGEMSLLTGEPRTATVTATADCELLEIGSDAFRRVVMADAGVLERVSTAVTTRREALERHRETRSNTDAPLETPQTFLARVRQFLRL